MTLQRAALYFQSFSLAENTGFAAFSTQNVLPPELVSAHPQRQKEFWAGRYAAYEALRKKSEKAAAEFLAQISVRDADGLPLWPRAFVGSISHSRGFALACVAEMQSWRSVGVDTEALTRPMPETALRQRVLLPEEEELAAVKAQHLRLIFSIKECFYKCCFPLVRQYLGFHGLQVLTIGADTWEAKLCEDYGEFKRDEIFQGNYWEEKGQLCVFMGLSVLK